jgi:hypothetical protein
MTIQNLNALLTLIFLLSVHSMYAQGNFISGKVSDKASNEALIGANIQLIQLPDSVQKGGAISDIDGTFIITNVKEGKYLLRISYLGYATLNKTIFMGSYSLKDVNLQLEEDATMLKETQVEGLMPRMTLSGDTAQFNADAYKVNPDATAEDLVRKMAGITVQDGKVQSQGEEVKRIMVDGKEFFGQDVNAALKNLPADMIQRIQVFDRTSDQAAFTGFNDGNTEKTINIVTKPAMSMGLFGRVYAGYGTDNRYSGGGNINYFEKSRRISLVGLSNNINQQNFSGEDLSGVAATGMPSNMPNIPGMAGMRPRGGGGVPRGADFYNATDNFLVGQLNGVSASHAYGINYDDAWGTQWKVTGSYFFNTSNNTNLSRLVRQYFPGETAEQLYNENRDANTKNFNHRLAGRIEWTIDSNNSILIIPRASLQNTRSVSTTEGRTSLINSTLLSLTENNNNSLYKAMNVSSTFLWRHKFSKKGRTLSINLQPSYNQSHSDANLVAENTFYQQGDSLFVFDQLTDQSSRSVGLSSEWNYTEPVGKNGQMQITWNPSFTKSASNRLTSRLDDATQDYTITDSLLSNNFDNITQFQRGGLSYRYNKGKISFNLGMNYQFTTLNSDRRFPTESTIDKTFHNVLPNAFLRYDISKTANLRVFYRTFVRAPGISQLQDVVDNSNPLLLSTGNKDLNQQYNHFLGMRFQSAKIAKGLVTFGFLGGGVVRDYITNSTFIAGRDTVLPGNIFIPAGGQLRRPVNANGLWSIRSFVSQGLPLLFIKCNLNINAGFSFTRTPSFINDIVNNSDNFNLNTGLVLGSNISEKIDFRITYTANFNIVKYSIQEQLNNNFYAGVAGAAINVLPWKGLVLNTDINYNHFSGLGDDFNNNFALWNAAVGYKFLKNKAAEFRVQVFDILNTNNSISRNITETYVEDNQNNALGRYFMLQFNYRVNKFPFPGSKAENKKVK